VFRAARSPWRSRDWQSPECPQLFALPEVVLGLSRPFSCGRSHTNHQDIHVAVGVRCPVSMRAEQDDLFGLEPLGDSTSEPANFGHGNVRSAKVARRSRHNRGRSAFATHAVILPRSGARSKVGSASAFAGARTDSGTAAMGSIPSGACSAAS
jgi:hypothetical protein